MPTRDLLALTEARAHLRLGDLDAATGAISRLAGVGGRFGNEARVISLEIALSRRDLQAVRLLAQQLPLRGILDAPAAVVALWAAGERLGEPDIQDRACAEAVRLMMLAGEDDRPPLARRLGPVVGWLATLRTRASDLG